MGVTIHLIWIPKQITDLQVPFTDSGCINEQLGQIEVFAKWYSTVLQLPLPVAQQEITKLLVEGARVREECCGQKNIAWNKSKDFNAKILLGKR